MNKITDLKEIKKGIYEVQNDAGGYYLNSGAIATEFNQPTDESDVQIITKDSYKVASWGKNNNLPSEREALVMKNHIMPALLEGKRDLLIGQKAILYKERYEGNKVIKEYQPMTDAVIDFLEENDFGKSIRLQAKDIILNAQNTHEYVKNSNGIASMKYIEARNIRAEETKNGAIKNWLIAENWKNPKNINAVQNFDKNKDQDKFIRRFCNEFLGGPYYYMPAWYGARMWILLTNIIPIFHFFNVKNGYTIRFHIEFPRGYFLKLKPTQNFAMLTEKDQKKALSDARRRKMKFLKEFNDTLKSEQNAGRAIHSTYTIDRMKGLALPGIKITPIDVNLKDEALLRLFDKGNDASIGAAGILPSLSGIAQSGKLSSGSDIKNALAFYLSTKTPEPRRVMYSPWVFALRKNNLIDRQTLMGSLDEIIVTTDKEKSGKEQR